MDYQHVARRGALS